jgi:hypothetical protein
MTMDPLNFLRRIPADWPCAGQILKMSLVRFPESEKLRAGLIEVELQRGLAATKLNFSG